MNKSATRLPIARVRKHVGPRCSIPYTDVNIFGVFLLPRYATDHSIYCAEPSDYGGGLALAPAKLNVIAFLFLAVVDRQRLFPAQDPDQPEGKILGLTLDGKPAPGNPNFGKTGAATIPLIDPPSDTEADKTAAAATS